VQGFFPGGINGSGVKLTTQVRLVARLRMIGAIPLLPLYAFIAWRGETLPFTPLNNDGTYHRAKFHEIETIEKGGSTRSKKRISEIIS
jgi:hypothetical protein